MDREVLRLMAHVDQTRAELRTALQRMDVDELVELFRDCTTGSLADMDESVQQLVGMLAAMAIYDICQSRDEADAPLPQPARCPRCGEDDIDQLVWIDDQQVRCASCGAVYEP
jgi:hypothetical protein